MWFSWCERGPGAYFVANVSKEQSPLLCVNKALQPASESSRKQRQRESFGPLCDLRDRMLPLFMQSIHLSVTLKVTLTRQFPGRAGSLH